jgi:ferredoxin-NADP reductase
MRAYQTTLLGRREVAQGTMAFQFEKPTDFVFKAGQYISSTRRTLGELGVDEDDIRTEEFAGYENQDSPAEPMISGDLSFQ